MQDGQKEESIQRYGRGLLTCKRELAKKKDKNINTDTTQYGYGDD